MNTKTTPPDRTSNPPVETIDFAQVRASIWTQALPEGKLRCRVQFGREVTDAEGGTTYGHNFNALDLILLGRVVEEAREACVALEAAAKERHEAGNSNGGAPGASNEPSKGDAS